MSFSRWSRPPQPGGRDAGPVEVGSFEAGSFEVGSFEVGSPPDLASGPDRARQICLDQLEYAPRTRAELAAVLLRKGVDDDSAEVVLSRFTEVGLIDDVLFAQRWVASRHRSKGLAGRALSQELRRKGIDDETVREAVGELDPEVELETARSLVERKLRTTTGLTDEARLRRLAGMLARKGYPAGLAFQVVKQALAAEGVELGPGTDPEPTDDA